MTSLDQPLPFVLPPRPSLLDDAPVRRSPIPTDVDASDVLVDALLTYARHMGAWTVLDTFAGEGGIGLGYAMRGAVVLAVDNDPIRLARNPFPALHADGIDAILRYGHLFDLVHASPPCTGYTRGTAAIPDRVARYPRMIPAVREALRITGRPYTIENVADARPELRVPILLCGRMFGLSAVDDDGVPLVADRHRLIETSWPIRQPRHPRHDQTQQVADAYDGARRDKHAARHVRHGGYVPASVDVQRQLRGVPWMSERGVWHSIPPTYGALLASAFLDYYREESNS